VDLAQIFIEVQWLLSVGLVDSAKIQLANFQKLFLYGQAPQIQTSECVVGGVDDYVDEESDLSSNGGDSDEYMDEDSDDDSDYASEVSHEGSEEGSEADDSGNGTGGGPVDGMQVDKGALSIPL
jgi:hypothetical protein